MAGNVSDVDRKVLKVIPTKQNKNFYIDDEGNFWRMYLFINGAKTFDVLENLNQAFQATKAFGEFQTTLSDFPDPKLHEIIPNFHNGNFRFENFLEALKLDPVNRAISAKKEIDFILKEQQVFGEFQRLITENKIPLRITHNDTKINNILFDDKTGEGICVIDLDIVMPGSVLYDFGDVVRSTVSTANEDEKDLSKVKIEIERFETLAKGFMHSAGKFLNKYEIENLPFSGRYITQLVGTRFLTDYILGDKYFKIHRPEHNLDRCRVQLEIVRSLKEHEKELHEIVQDFL